MEKILVATRIDGQAHRSLKEIGREEDRTVAYLVRRAVEQYLEGVGENKRRKPKEA